MYLVGIDIGGTKIAASISRMDAAILHTEQYPTPPGKNFTPVFAAARELVSKLLAAVGACESELAAIGLSCPGPLDLAGGIIVQVATNGWRGVPVRQLFEECYGVPICLENDANAAAYAEAKVGAGRGCGTVVYFTVSTGIGGGVYTQGRVLHGARGFAAELGHISVEPDGPACPCGGHGCVQLYASGTSIASHAAKAALGTGSPIAALAEVTALDVERGVRAGDEVCTMVWNEAMRRLGIAVGICNQVLDPDLFVFGGGVSNAWDLMERPVLESARRYCYTDAAKGLRFARARLGGLAGTTGALLLARERMVQKEYPMLQI